MSVSRVLGYDVNDRIDCVCPPDRATRSTNYLNALDIFQWSVLNLPPYASEERRIDAPPDDKHQHRPRQGTSKPAYANGPCVRVDARYVNPRCQARSEEHTSELQSPCNLV